MRPPVVVALVLLPCALLLVPVAPAAAPPKEPLVDQVRKAIKQGKDYLIRRQSIRGDWEGEAVGRPGGCTALALLALLYTKEPLDKTDYKADKVDEVIRKGLAYLRTVPPENTYVVGLQTMVYCLAGEDKQRIENNVKWLLTTRRTDGKRLLGWPYKADGGRPDASNTQYALLGLHEAQQAGIKIDRAVWDSVRDYYLNAQRPDGGYTYLPGDGRPLFTMTTAGLCGLIIAGGELNTAREKPHGDGSWDNCGKYVENEKIAGALQWLGKNFHSAATFGEQPWLFYTLYGLERAGRLTGLRFIGDPDRGYYDWYRVGCEYLTKPGRQNDDGSWQIQQTAGGPVISTSFALLFLSKGRTPILISKLTHDGKDKNSRIRSANGADNDWNNDRNDARHLVEFASRELFKRQPMGWQVFNAGDTHGISSDELAAELLQSPVAYFNGHLAPEFSEAEKTMLQTYVRNGGLIFAEACCGRDEFRAGFEALMKKLFPELELKQLDENHPVWTAAGKFAIPPRDRRRFPLYGIEMGCKTVVIFSPNDLSCRWESNQYADKGDNELAFHIGANVIAYATGLEPPVPRLTPVEVAKDNEQQKVERGYLRVGQLRYGEDWKPAPAAMPNLMREMRDKWGLDVQLKTEEVWATGKGVADYKFLYMHGRKSFTLPKDQLGELRWNLEHGGLLFADACCGSDAFNKSFREFITALWPDQKYKLEPIPLKDPLFGKELNGEAITTVRCRRDNGGRRDVEFQDYEPFLEGVKIKGRWAVIYSRWDIGCALEKHKSPACMGHDYASAVRLGRAAVLYHLRP
jgi:hypothetical protein